MGQHKQKKTKISDLCRSVSLREQQQNGDKNRKGKEKKS